jgi:hypothetical protein
MFTGDQLVAHLVGDYVLQTDWMVKNKTTRNLATLVPSVVYSLPFLFITQKPLTLAIIVGTHFLIDRWQLARYVAWTRNLIFPGSKPWPECSQTGFHREVPAHLSIWLLIIIDNTMHILINGAAITYIG